MLPEQLEVRGTRFHGAREYLKRYSVSSIFARVWICMIPHPLFWVACLFLFTGFTQDQQICVSSSWKSLFGFHLMSLLHLKSFYFIRFTSQFNPREVKWRTLIVNPAFVIFVMLLFVNFSFNSIISSPSSTSPSLLAALGAATMLLPLGTAGTGPGH